MIFRRFTLSFANKVVKAGVVRSGVGTPCVVRRPININHSKKGWEKRVACVPFDHICMLHAKQVIQVKQMKQVIQTASKARVKKPTSESRS